MLETGDGFLGYLETADHCLNWEKKPSRDSKRNGWELLAELECVGQQEKGITTMCHLIVI